MLRVALLRDLIDVHISLRTASIVFAEQVLPLGGRGLRHPGLDVPRVPICVIPGGRCGHVSHVLLGLILGAVKHTHVSGGDSLLGVVAQEVAGHNHDFVID